MLRARIDHFRGIRRDQQVPEIRRAPRRLVDVDDEGLARDLAEHLARQARGLEARGNDAEDAERRRIAHGKARSVRSCAARASPPAPGANGTITGCVSPDLLHGAAAVAGPPGRVHRVDLLGETGVPEEARVGVHRRVARDVSRQRLARGGGVVGDARADERGDLEIGERAAGLLRPGFEVLDRGRHGLGRDPVQHHPVGDLAGQLEHLRPERREDDAHRLGGRRDRQSEVLHLVELALEAHALAGGDRPDDLHGFANLLERWREAEPVPVPDDDLAREPDAEHDPVGREVIERGRALAEDDGRSRLDR